MATSPPGDIILDVMRAAEPAAVEVARERLQSFAANKSGNTGKFAAIEASPRPAPSRTNFAAGETASHGNATHVQFEAMVLQSFIQSMLPEDSESIFGSGMAGDMWKSMMAEQLATTMAKRGGIGIAERVLGDIDNGQQVAMNDDRDTLAARNLQSESLIHEIQRKMMNDIGPQSADHFNSSNKSD